MEYYNFNYTMLSDGTVLVQYMKHSEDGKTAQPTYQTLIRDIATAIEYADNLNAKKVK